MPSMTERLVRAISTSLELSYDQSYLLIKANWLSTQINTSAMRFNPEVGPSRIFLVDDNRDIVRVRTIANILSSGQILLLFSPFPFLLDLLSPTRRLAPNLSALALLGIGYVIVSALILISAFLGMISLSVRTIENANSRWREILQTIRADLIPVLEAELADLRVINTLEDFNVFRNGALPVGRAARLYRATGVIQVQELSLLLMNRARRALPLPPAPRIARAIAAAVRRDDQPALIVARARGEVVAAMPIGPVAVGASHLPPRSISSEDMRDEPEAGTMERQPSAAVLGLYRLRGAAGGGGGPHPSYANPLHGRAAPAPDTAPAGEAGGDIPEWQTPARR
jgi:hypothetical protein